VIGIVDADPLLLHTAAESTNYPWLHGKSYILDIAVGLMWMKKLHTVNSEYSKAAVGKGLLYCQYQYKKILFCIYGDRRGDEMIILRWILGNRL
jgi:hypothetical protein